MADLLHPHPRPAVPLSALLHSPPGPALLTEAAARAAEGYRTLKWKLGRAPWPEERAALQALRLQHSDVALRLDVNQRWTRAQAEARLADLAELGIESVEEPCPPPFPASPVPLAADESLRSITSLDELGDVRALVLKPMVLGLDGSQRWAAVAEARGLGLIVTHLFDGPLALAFGLAAAAALPGHLWPSGLAPHPGLAGWGVSEFRQVSGGWGRPSGPGLGLPRLGGDVDEQE